MKKGKMTIALTGPLILETIGFGTAILASPIHGFDKFENFITRY